MAKKSKEPQLARHKLYAAQEAEAKQASEKKHKKEEDK